MEHLCYKVGVLMGVKRILIVALALPMLLCGCSKPEPEEPVHFSGSQSFSTQTVTTDSFTLTKPTTSTDFSSIWDTTIPHMDTAITKMYHTVDYSEAEKYLTELQEGFEGLISGLQLSVSKTEYYVTGVFSDGTISYTFTIMEDGSQTVSVLTSDADLELTADLFQALLGFDVTAEDVYQILNLMYRTSGNEVSYEMTLRDYDCGNTITLVKMSGGAYIKGEHVVG